MDLLLVHPPALFDFRKRRDIYLPYLSTSGAVPVTPLFEYFPLGFKSLQRYLGERGHDVRILNASTLFLKYPDLDVERILAAIDAPLIGLDLHWMVHVQGCLELARRIRKSTNARVILGGISATWYAKELISYPFVDFVMGGYDTHEPMAMLMADLARGVRDFSRIPNLTWKDARGEIHENPLSHNPDAFACGLDWSVQPSLSSQSGVSGQASVHLPIREVLSTQNAGCAYNCGWCGGSRDAFRRIFGKSRAMARKPLSEVEYEFGTLRAFPDVESYHFYSIGSYNESPSRLQHFLDRIRETNFRSVSYEQFHLPSDSVMREMVRANRRTSLTLSPESHDHRVATLAGRGVYTNQQLEEWLRRALDIGIHSVDIWYFIGMPEQDVSSVEGTVRHCERLLRLFPGGRVSPLICTMIPFLDPASNFFEHPAEHGYRVFYRSAEEHRRSMERASLVHRVNYETRWLSREEIVDVGYRAVRELTEIKAGAGLLPSSLAARIVSRIDDAVAFGRAVHEIDCITDEGARGRALEGIGDEIVKRNDELLFHGVANQAFPIEREIGGRWFDELLFTADEIDRLMPGGEDR